MVSAGSKNRVSFYEEIPIVLPGEQRQSLNIAGIRGIPSLREFTVLSLVLVAGCLSKQAHKTSEAVIDQVEQSPENVKREIYLSNPGVLRLFPGIIVDGDAINGSHDDETLSLGQTTSKVRKSTSTTKKQTVNADDRPPQKKANGEGNATGDNTNQKEQAAEISGLKVSRTKNDLVLQVADRQFRFAKADLPERRIPAEADIEITKLGSSLVIALGNPKHQRKWLAIDNGTATDLEVLGLDSKDLSFEILSSIERSPVRMVITGKLSASIVDQLQAILGQNRLAYVPNLGVWLITPIITEGQDQFANTDQTRWNRESAAIVSVAAAKLKAMATGMQLDSFTEFVINLGQERSRLAKTLKSDDRHLFGEPRRNGLGNNTTWEILKPVAKGSWARSAPLVISQLEKFAREKRAEILGSGNAADQDGHVAKSFSGGALEVWLDPEDASYFGMAHKIQSGVTYMTIDRQISDIGFLNVQSGDVIVNHNDPIEVNGVNRTDEWQRSGLLFIKDALASSDQASLLKDLANAARVMALDPPFRRGSASVIEWIMMATAQAKGYYLVLPPEQGEFARWDLQAFAMPLRETYVDWFASQAKLTPVSP